MANVALTDVEKTSLRGDGGTFKSYLVQKVINQIGLTLGGSSFTTQTARWFVFGKTYIASPTTVTNDPNLTEFAVARMITAGLAFKNDAGGATLADQVVSYLQTNVPDNIPQAYLDERTKQWS